MKIKKNDTVVVLSGKDKGKQGKVLVHHAHRRTRFMVEGINMADCHIVKPRKQGRGERHHSVRRSPCRASKVMLVCPKCGKATRGGYKILEDGSKVRVCTSKHGCGETVLRRGAYKEWPRLER